MSTNNHTNDGDIVIDFSEEIQNPPQQQQPQDLSQNSIQKDSNQQEQIKNQIFTALGVAESSNPIICILHMIFKVLSMITYLFSGWVLNSITIFIFVSVFSVLDFWVVKNLSGRILAGLRWWRIINEKGEEVWKFESRDTNVQSNKIDTTIFWQGQILTTLFWLIISSIKLLFFQFFWFILASTSFLLVSINLYAYYQCRKDYKQKVNEYVQGSQLLQGALFSGLRSRLGF